MLFDAETWRGIAVFEKWPLIGIFVRLRVKIRELWELVGGFIGSYGSKLSGCAPICSNSWRKNRSAFSELTQEISYWRKSQAEPLLPQVSDALLMVDDAEGELTGSSQIGMDEHVVVVDEYFVVEESELQEFIGSLRIDIQLSPASMLKVRTSSW
jgi:hypothetical protein